MPVAQLTNIEFTEADLQKIDHALLMLEETFAGKLIQDNSYLKINEQEIENLTVLPKDEGTVLTEIIPAFANMNQWSSDERAREQLDPIATRLKNIAQQVVYTNRAVLQRCWNSSSKY
jgi:hypothetical protein